MAKKFHEFARPETEKQASKNSCQEAPCSSGREPIEIETRGFGGGLLHNGRCSKHFAMQIWPVPSRRAGPRFAIRHHHPEGRCRRLIHGQLYAGQSPQEHEDGENCEGQPSLGGLAGRVVLSHFVAFHLCGIFDALVFKSPDSLRLPHAEENHRGYQGNDSGGDVHAGFRIGKEAAGG